MFVLEKEGAWWLWLDIKIKKKYIILINLFILKSYNYTLVKYFALHRANYFILYILGFLDVCVTAEDREDAEMPLLIPGVLFGLKFF